MHVRFFASLRMTASRNLCSLTNQEYLLVDSEEKKIAVYRRENHWQPYHYNEGDDVELTSPGVTFPFDAVYRRIKLA